MKKLICSIFITFSLISLIYGRAQKPPADCHRDIKDHRGEMTPWKKGAHETGKYRNVFLDAGYMQADIDAKLAKAYYDVFEGPSKVYFEVGDSMAYVSDVKNHDACTEGLSYGLMVAVQLNKKAVFDKLWR